MLFKNAFAYIPHFSRHMEVITIIVILLYCVSFGMFVGYLWMCEWC